MPSLYRKYRPSSFAEVIGQSHVVTTLQNALAHKRVGHAYLFTGPRGTGKTTIARILAKELGTQTLDVIEIDAASNRGIDEARDLKEKVQVVPASSPYKVFIIDEVHMLTKEAFNALLKTLEEPPAHAIFVLATTEPEKIPETIISRTQRFDFRKISNEKIKEHLLEIAGKEDAKLNPEAAAIIAQNADGAVRDALSVLDQLIHSSEDKTIEPQRVREVLGLPPLTLVQEMVGYFIEKDTSRGIAAIAKLSESGIDFYLFLAHLIEYVRSLLLVVSYPDATKPPMSESEESVFRSQLTAVSQPECLKWLAALFQARENMKVSPIPSLPLEIALVSITGGNNAGKTLSEPKARPKAQPAEQTEVVSKMEPSTTRPLEEKPLGKADGEVKKESVEEPKEAHSEEVHAEKEVTASADSMEKAEELVNIEPISSAGNFGIEEVFARWSEALLSVKQKNFVVGGFLRGGAPVEIQNDTLLIACKFPFHKDKIEDRKNRFQIEEVLEKLFGKKMQISCVLESELTEEQRSKLRDKEKEQEIVLTKNALEMFEGKMVGE